MKFITKTCLHCNNEFEASLKEHNRGNARFCTLSCSAKFNGAKLKPEPNLTCSFCSTPMYKNRSKQKISKSGFMFCSRECKDNAQRIVNIDTFAAMMPDHYKDGSQAKYRVTAFKIKPKICEDCGYDAVPEILQVHHMDRNRTNNDISNLKVLCPNCHQIEHYKNRDGLWTKKKTDDVSEVYDSV